MRTQTAIMSESAHQLLGHLADKGVHFQVSVATPEGGLSHSSRIRRGDARSISSS